MQSQPVHVTHDHINHMLMRSHAKRRKLHTALHHAHGRRACEIEQNEYLAEKLEMIASIKHSRALGFVD